MFQYWQRVTYVSFSQSLTVHAVYTYGSFTCFLLFFNLHLTTLEHNPNKEIQNRCIVMSATVMKVAEACPALLSLGGGTHLLAVMNSLCSVFTTASSSEHSLGHKSLLATDVQRSLQLPVCQTGIGKPAFCLHFYNLENTAWYQ